MSKKPSFKQQMVNEVARVIGFIMRLKVSSKALPPGMLQTHLWDEVVKDLTEQLVCYKPHCIHTDH